MEAKKQTNIIWDFNILRAGMANHWGKDEHSQHKRSVEKGALFNQLYWNFS